MESQIGRMDFYFNFILKISLVNLMGSGWCIKFWHEVWCSQRLMFGSFCVSEFSVVELELGGACKLQSLELLFL